METKNNQTCLEDRLIHLKDELLTALNRSKLVLNPVIDLKELTIKYERRRGTNAERECQSIVTGIRALLNRLYGDNANLSARQIDEVGRNYEMSLTVVGNNTKDEEEKTYVAIEKITKFLYFYSDLKRNTR